MTLSASEASPAELNSRTVTSITSLTLMAFRATARLQTHARIMTDATAAKLKDLSTCEVSAPVLRRRGRWRARALHCFWS